MTSTDDELPGLLEVLAQVPDPRRTRGPPLHAGVHAGRRGDVRAGHGRIIKRSLWVTDAAGMDFPQWLAAQVWAALHGLVVLRLNAPGFPWPGPLEQMADQIVARLIGLDTPADRHPA